IKPSRWYEVSGTVLGDRDVDSADNFGGVAKSLNTDFVIRAESFNLLPDTDSVYSKPFIPRILACDIEVDELEIGKGKILMISLYGDNIRKVLSWKKPHNSSTDFVEVFKNEKLMLEAFVNYVKDYSPDIITGYFSDSFDLPYI